MQEFIQALNNLATAISKHADALTGSTAPVNVVTADFTPPAQPTQDQPAEKAKRGPRAKTPAETPATPESPAVTFDDLRAQVKRLAQEKNLSAEVQAILGEFKVKKLSEVAEKNFPELKAKLDKLEGGGSEESSWD